MSRQCLITGTPPETFLLALQALEYTPIVCGESELIEESEFQRAIADCEIYVSGGFEKATKSVLNAAKKLRLVVFLGVDFSPYIDGAVARTLGIDVASTPGANSQAVAEFTIALMLDASRHVSDLVSEIRRGRWGSYFGNELMGGTVGIFGLGAVGARVAAILTKGFGSKVFYWSRSRKPELENELGLRFSSVEQILSSATILSLHLPVPDPSKYFFSTNEFAQMLDTAILVNTSRSELVDPVVLLDSLKSDKLAYAAFDGFYREGPSFDQGLGAELLQLPENRFLLSPHTAWKTHQTDERVYAAALSSITAFATTGRALNVGN